jgi:hypothetical protein
MLMKDSQPKSWWRPAHWPKIKINLNKIDSARGFHRGIYYRDYLKQVHEVWKPSSYLEIGVESGATLAFAECRSVAVDPQFRFHGNPIGRRAETHLFQMTSDAFFAQRNLPTFFPEGIDFAFLDGMHHFEYLFRDFFNTERYSHKKTIVALHDCHPTNSEMANREANYDRRDDATTRIWWTGDVWKLLPILREFRPDLDVAVLDCPPTGLVIIRGLDPTSDVLGNAYGEIVGRYRDVTLQDFGIERFRKEFPTKSSTDVFQPAALVNFLSNGEH